jgi:Cu(I)/Ag(I) efflux system protein CusF
MKRVLVAAAAVALASPAVAQSGGDMKGMSGMSNMQTDHGSMVMADGEGIVQAVDPRAGSVTIQHGPIAALKWPAMTMTFKASNPALLQGVSAGQTVKFQLMQMGGAITLTAIQPK